MGEINEYCCGREYHEATKHSWLSVRRSPNRLDWEKQPSSMKFYPDSLPRTPLLKDVASHRLVYNIAGITAKKSYPGVEYYLRTNPSAGALYPNELYFQAVGVEGFEDGIYHFEVGSSSAVLLLPLKEDEGLEPLLNLPSKMRGLLFLVSSIYYRSSWKYKKRAFRYCLLDGGHILGALEAASHIYGHAYRILYDIKLKELNTFFGFGREEFFLSAAICTVPEKRSVAIPESGPVNADAAGEFEPEPIIERTYLECTALKPCRKEARFPKIDLHKERLQEAILNRRSIREFSKRPILKEQFEMIMRYINQPIPGDCDEPVEIFAVINRVEDMQKGVWHDGKIVKEGDFSERAGYLCLEQRLGSYSAVTLFLLSNGCNYRALYQKAGTIGHRAYLASEYLGLGCSGIGAYYDDDVNTFLETDGMVLYALAIGV
ncbi:hypothetical protein NNO_1482 [Hydrogenimonas sp.]|nr:hypothetical protein NNO_1482 [Hydrogenimonas sp.]